MYYKNFLDKIMKILVLLLDINLIENVWVVMKLYFIKIVKLKKKEEFVVGIRDFWNGFFVDGCQKFIDYIYKVILVVVLNSGEQLGYQMCCFLFDYEFE